MTDLLNDYFAFNISSILGLCKKTKFPGTMASFAGLILSFSFYYFFSKEAYLIFFLILLPLSFWAINKVHEKLGAEDYQWIGIDEFVGMWLVNFFLFEFNFNFTEAVIFSLISFLIFRIIDILKFIPPLSAINNNKNQRASAVILDDIVASFYTYFILLLILASLGFYNINFFYSSFLILLTPMIANMTPTLIKIKYWNTAINEKLFGKNKTWRGFLGAIIVGTLSFLALVKSGMIASIPDSASVFLVGFLFSFGAILGDLVKSLFKRKMGIRPGGSWLPFDQIDYVLGMIILTYPLYRYTLSQMVLFLVIGGALSAIAHRLGYLIKINSAKQ